MPSFNRSKYKYKLSQRSFSLKVICLLPPCEIAWHRTLEMHQLKRQESYRLQGYATCHIMQVYPHCTTLISHSLDRVVLSPRYHVEYFIRLIVSNVIDACTEWALSSLHRPPLVGQSLFTITNTIRSGCTEPLCLQGAGYYPGLHHYTNDQPKSCGTTVHTCWLSSWTLHYTYLINVHALPNYIVTPVSLGWLYPVW